MNKFKDLLINHQMLSAAVAHTETDLESRLSEFRPAVTEWLCANRPYVNLSSLEIKYIINHHLECRYIHQGGGHSVYIPLDELIKFYV